MAAAVGIASKPPSRPNSEPPMRAAIIVTTAGTETVRFIILG